jgi:hypothetical protein
MPDGKRMANVWEGNFPYQNRSPHKRTSPIKAFPPNGYGLYDMIGNVWNGHRIGTLHGAALRRQSLAALPKTLAAVPRREATIPASRPSRFPAKY